MSQLAIGSTVWLLDHNRRRYDSDRRLIFSECFVPSEITGETRDSWIIGATGFLDKYKVNKKTLELRGDPIGKGRRVYVTQSEIDDAVYINDHRSEIARAVGDCRDAAVLRQIAAMLARAKP